MKVYWMKQFLPCAPVGWEGRAVRVKNSDGKETAVRLIRTAKVLRDGERALYTFEYVDSDDSDSSESEKQPAGKKPVKKAEKPAAAKPAAKPVPASPQRPDRPNWKRPAGKLFPDWFDMSLSEDFATLCEGDTKLMRQVLDWASAQPNPSAALADWIEGSDEEKIPY